MSSSGSKLGRARRSRATSSGRNSVTRAAVSSQVISYQRLFEGVYTKAQLKSECVDTIRSFFYPVYSRSLATSLFAGLEMDLVSYSMELIQSHDDQEVLGGSRILESFVERSHAFQSDTLRCIGFTPGAIDRLVEMLAWHHRDEKEIRLNSAAIVKALAVSGSLENIMSLIQWDDVDRNLHVEGKHAAPPPREVVELRTYGLAYSSASRWTMRTASALERHRVFLRSWWISSTFLRMLAGTTGRSGNTLRPAIANVVSAIPQLRDILHTRPTEISTDLHEQAADVLKNQALDEHSREVIGATGGVISNLMLLFTRRPLRLMPSLRCEASATDVAPKFKEGGLSYHLRASMALLEILEGEDDEALGILAAQILRGTLVYMSPAVQDEVSQHIEFLVKRVISCSDGRLPWGSPYPYPLSAAKTSAACLRLREWTGTD